MTKAYAGIGSRETPDDILHLMTGFAGLAEEHGWTLRSGGADGADTAFENGVKHRIHKEIYLPWGGFNGSDSHLTKPMALASQLVERYHPNTAALTQGAMKLHMRNMHQILGRHLETPVKFVLCWTKNAALVGGTATAIRCAMDNGIPVFNLADPNIDEEGLERILYG